MNTVLALLFVIIAAAARADDFASHFSVVMIDDKTEAKLGAFPLDRARIAEAIDTCARDGAKAVVLKFFFDLPKTVASDAALANAIGKLPVALEARLKADGDTLPIPARFRFAPGLSSAVGADRGWIPLPSLMQRAAAIGFVDFATPAIPLVETYRGVAYKSLVVCCLEFACDAPARVDDHRIWFGAHFVPVDGRNVFHADLDRPESFAEISFVDLLLGRVPKAEIEQRVVIIGWDGTRTPTLPTAHGAVKIHRYFVQSLAATYRTLMLTPGQ